MSSPMFQALGGAQSMPNDGGFSKMMREFRQFCQTFQGDPKQEVMRLLQSGQMSQQELDMLQSFAQQYRSFFQGGNP